MFLAAMGQYSHNGVDKMRKWLKTRTSVL